MDLSRKRHTHQPHKRSSFRMPISRRYRSEFTPLPQNEVDSPEGISSAEAGNSRTVMCAGNKSITLKKRGATPKEDWSRVSPRKDKYGIRDKKSQEETIRLLDKVSLELEDCDESGSDLGIRNLGKSKGTNVKTYCEDGYNVQIFNPLCERMKRDKNERVTGVPDDKRQLRELDLIVATERKWRRRDFSSSVLGPLWKHESSNSASPKQYPYKRGSGPCEFETASVTTRIKNSFRSRRKSFGSESEKRRGERFQREREMEQMGNKASTHCLSEDEDVDFNFDFYDESSDSESHICDFSCPLVLHGPCPRSLPGGKNKLKAQRRSSFASSSSRENVGEAAHANTYLQQHSGAFASAVVGATPGSTGCQSLSLRLKPLASLSIEDLPSGVPGPLRSPGLLSTASMWSTSDLRQAGASIKGGVPGVASMAFSKQGKPADGVSHSGGTTSLSNVSGSLSERMHELVRAFSSRTQRAKKKISQPPTPSSESDYDAQSGASGGEEPAPGPRTIRSFLPSESRVSDAFSHENPDHFVGVWHCKVKMPRWIKKVRFPATLEPHSKIYVSWLFLVTLAFMYNAIVIPLRGVFPYQTGYNVRYWMCADYFCDIIYLLDIILFKSRLRFINNGIGECDKKEVRKNYTRQLTFKLDIASLTPLDLFYLVEGVGVNVWLRLPRVLKIQSYWEFYERCDQASRSFGHAIRIIKTMTYMLFLIHIETCGYYAVSNYQGIASNRWVYQGDGIAYIRCFYLATKTATSIGNNPKPTNNLEYIFMTIYWLSGVFVFALLIGQIRDIVEAAGMVKDTYRKKMDSCLWYMQSINLPGEMKDKVREWFLYNWEQQKTIDERSLVSSLPRKLQTDLAINVHFNTLSKVQLFQDCERNLLYDLVLKLRPILYLPGDYICQKGEVGKEMYIVTQGQVEVVGGENNHTVLATLHEGSVFGEISLLAMSGRGNRRTADVRCKGYTNVFTLSKHDFEMAMTEYPDAQALLKKRAKRLLKANARMEKKHKKVEAEEIIRTPPETPKMLQTVIQIMDPDSNLVKHLTPSIRHNQGILRRPHSRSHSHRLSPSVSQMQHLSPHRSHSYRHQDTTTACSEVIKLTSSDEKDLTHVGQAAPEVEHFEKRVAVEKTGYCTDEEADEPVFDDTSDDVSLSEILHDAGAGSSFDEDNDDEDDDDNNDGMNKIWDARKKEGEPLVIMDTENVTGKNFDSLSAREIIGCQSKLAWSPQDTNTLSFAQNEMSPTVDTEDLNTNSFQSRFAEHNFKEAEINSGDSQDSGLPDAQRPGSHGKEESTSGGIIKSPPLRPESKLPSSIQTNPNAHPLDKISQVPYASWTNEFTTEHPLQSCGYLSNEEANTALEQTDLLGDFEDHQIKDTSIDTIGSLNKKVLKQQAADAKEENVKVLSGEASSTISSHSSTNTVSCFNRVQKLAPPSLVLFTASPPASLPSTSPLTGSPTSTLTGSGRVRKLSVITPPISPDSNSFSKHASLVAVTSPISASPGVVNLANLVSVNDSPQIGSSEPFSNQIVTPVETIPIRALPPIKIFDKDTVEIGLEAGTGLGGTDLPDTGGKGSNGCRARLGSVRTVEQSLATAQLSNGLESQTFTAFFSNPSSTKDNQGDYPKARLEKNQGVDHNNAIPAQNRVMCAVEIHRPKSVSPAGGAESANKCQLSHKETAL